MKILSIVGARPQFVKAAAVSRVLRRDHEEILVHTGQHYDDNMSNVFFEELDIPPPDFHLGVGSCNHGEQTGAMLDGIEKLLLAERPEWVLVYGDTNSTLAGALAAAKLRCKVAHVEAGLRSFNRAMPEEINRVVVDHLADLLFCPGEIAVANLAAEGITQGVVIVGDVMADVLRTVIDRKRGSPTFPEQLGLTERGYLLATVHRAENTDNPVLLKNILHAFDSLDEPVIFPVHPRTRKAIDAIGYIPSRHVRLMEPLGYLDMTALERTARMILTDSGGIQKEAYWLGVPCLTLRDETEWVETVESGWNFLVGAGTERIVQAVQTFRPPFHRPLLYGNGNAAVRISQALTLERLPRSAHGKIDNSALKQTTLSP